MSRSVPSWWSAAGGAQGSIGPVAVRGDAVRGSGRRAVLGGVVVAAVRSLQNIRARWLLAFLEGAYTDILGFPAGAFVTSSGGMVWLAIPARRCKEAVAAPGWRSAHLGRRLGWAVAVRELAAGRLRTRQRPSGRAVVGRWLWSLAVSACGLRHLLGGHGLEHFYAWVKLREQVIRNIIIP